MTKDIKYSIVDVFTNEQFSGNPLAVIHNGQDLNKDEMQKIATEFGFSETSFICPPRDTSSNAHVRIFTPMEEISFAGHPNIGTAFVIAHENTAARFDGTSKMSFDELGGIVDVTLISDKDTVVGATIIAPSSLEILGDCDASLVAECLGLPLQKIKSDHFHPCVASVGLPFAFVEIDDVETLSDIKLNNAAFEKAALVGPSTVDGFCICAFSILSKTDDHITIRSRVFSPLGHPAEDPATGSASGALGALLTKKENKAPYTINITQGVEMGRRSDITVKLNTINAAPLISGNSVKISHGVISL